NSVKVVATDRLTYGDVTVHADGSITYTPKPDYSGSDSFTYTTTEDGVEVRTTVTVTVNPVADKPDFDSGSGAVDTFEDVAIALGLKAPKVTDNVDQTGAADNVDNPELLGVITLSG